MLVAAWTVFICCCPAHMARAAAATEAEPVVAVPAGESTDPHACCKTDQAPDQQRPAHDEHQVPPAEPDHRCGCGHADKAAATEKAPTVLSSSPAHSFNPVLDLVPLPPSMVALPDELTLGLSRAPIADPSALPCAPTLLSLGCQLTT